MTLRLAFMGTPDFAVPALAGETRPAQPGKSVQWTDLSDERRELGRAARGHQ
jgi:methionyl-tRNA formyltransferase